MAVGRALQHRIFHPGPVHQVDATKRLQWRFVVLMVLAVLAAAFASYSLVVDPPDSAPPSTSYLPSGPPDLPSGSPD